MTDQTTQGYEADPADVRSLLMQAIGDIGDELDPTIRYTMLSKQLVLYDAVVSTIADERAQAVAAMSEPGGMSYAMIAEALQISRSRAQQLVQRGTPRRRALAMAITTTAPVDCSRATAADLWCEAVIDQGFDASIVGQNHDGNPLAMVHGGLCTLLQKGNTVWAEPTDSKP